MLYLRYHRTVMIFILNILMVPFSPNKSSALQCSEILKNYDKNNFENNLVKDLNQLIMSIRNEKNVTKLNSLKNKLDSLFREANLILSSERVNLIFQQLNHQTRIVKNDLTQKKVVKNTDLEIANSVINVFPLKYGYLLKRRPSEYFYFGSFRLLPQVLKKDYKNINEIIAVYPLSNSAAVYITVNDHFIYSSGEYKSNSEPLQYPKSQIIHTYDHGYSYNNLLFIFDNGKIHFTTKRTTSNKSFLKQLEKIILNSSMR